MKKKVSRPLRVYLCKSNLTFESELRAVRESLIDLGFEVAEHTMGSTYDPIKLDQQDFLLMVRPLGRSKKSGTGKRTTWATTVGRGQYDEVLRAVGNHMPAFVYMGQNTWREPLMSKIEEFRGCHTQIGTDWRTYGEIKSYVLGNSPTSLANFVFGYFFTRETNPIFHTNRAVHPLVPEECYNGKKRLLLLLNN